MSETVEKKSENNAEVVEKASRRRFTAKYKHRISMEAEHCSKPTYHQYESTREGKFVPLHLTQL